MKEKCLLHPKLELGIIVVKVSKGRVIRQDVVVIHPLNSELELLNMYQVRHRTPQTGGLEVDSPHSPSIDPTLTEVVS